MTLAFRRRTTASIAVGICAASCGRIGFDLLPRDSQQAVSNDAAAGTGGAGLGGTADASSSGGAGGTSSGGRSGNGGTTSSGGTGYGGISSGGASGGSGGTTDASAPDAAGGSQSGGASGTGGAGGSSSGGASSTGGGGPDSGPPPVCASTSGTVQVWSFNSTVESWAYWPNLGPGTLSWTAATGNPTAGSLAVDVTSGDGVLGWIVFDSPPTANLSGRTGSVWLYLDSGTVGVKLYVQSNRSTYTWADGGFVTLTPKTWTCVTIDFSAPDYNDAGYDPTNIVRFGVELAGLGPVRVYADQFAY